MIDDPIGEFREYAFDADSWTGSGGLLVRMLEHLAYTGLALLIAAAIALPLGMLIGHTGKGAFVAINTANAARALPTLGLLVLVVLVTTIGITPVMVALVILGIPPILASTYAGIRGVDPAAVDAARGMGMSEREVLTQVEIPIALPLMISGLRAATLQIVATATIAAYVALGGLGRPLLDSIALQEHGVTITAALLVAIVAITLDLLFIGISRLGVSPGLDSRRAAKMLRKTGTATETART